MTEHTGYEQDIINAVWNKGFIVPGWNPATYRLDRCGAIMERAMYGDRSMENNRGWEIDHIMPRSIRNNDDLDNLQPLQWTNNVLKGDDYPANYSDEKYMRRSA